MGALVIYLTEAGRVTAERIAAHLGVPLRRCGTGGEDARSLLQAGFVAGEPIVAVAASGIVVRLLAPLITDKQVEPPVVSVSADGKHVVPLLGGHHGANDLARDLAEVTGGVAAITTASDSRFGRALDDPPDGFVLADPAPVKGAMAALLDGESISLTGMAGWLGDAGYPIAEDGQVAITSGIEITQSDVLTYHPRVLVAGVGCERGTSAAEIIGLIEKVLFEAGISSAALAALATIDLKEDEAGLLAAAAHFNVPVRLFAPEELAAEEARLVHPSEFVRAETGTPGVAEAAALKAGRLLIAKQKSKRATCAIGIAPEVIDVSRFGRSPGSLHVIGIGPGEAGQRTASAIEALRLASDWVGYGLYLDLVADLGGDQTVHRFDLGEEQVRVTHALKLAAEGRRVALICSGDAQIYAMASLVYEQIEDPAGNGLPTGCGRVAIEVHPGISAFQMASARMGAIIGHDFCTISLSDLLTPREIILKRLAAAAAGDFVTALYNPRSKKRVDLIASAQMIFLEARPADTPVIVASNLGRDQERVNVTTLEAFRPDEIDMMTIVIFGSSQSRQFVRGSGRDAVFTPRGYADKDKST